MKLYTTKLMISTVAERFRRQYKQYFGTSWKFSDGTKPEPMAVRLDALPSNATVADVEAIMGASNVLDIHCNECGKYVDVAVELGEPPDYESATTMICLDCLRKAVALAERGDA